MIVLRAIGSVALTALAVWLGGLLALGAIVAPIVFGVVAFPASADAMTLVFRRFDTVAVACVVLLLAAEVALSLVHRALSRLDVVRASVTLLGSVLVLVEAFGLSPKIEALHRAGAIRGLGDLGDQLERAHALAEAVGKAQAFVALALVVLYVVTLTSPQRASLRARSLG